MVRTLRSVLLHMQNYLSGGALPILLLLALPTQFAEAADPVTIRNLTGRSVGHHLDYLRDEESVFTIEQVAGEEFESKWKKSDFDVPSFGFTDASYWFRMTFVNDRDVAATRYRVGVRHFPYPILTSAQGAV